MLSTNFALKELRSPCQIKREFQNECNRGNDTEWPVAVGNIIHL